MGRVLIIGGGIAGCSAATMLASVPGIEVVVFERTNHVGSPATPKYGESLPPDARHLLKQLGVWDEFQTSGHLPCHYHKSYWGTEVPSFRDFMSHPLGHGWHLDRVAFEKTLEQRCRSLGVSIHYGASVEKVERRGSAWSVNGNEEFDFVIDASGRSSWFAKKQGAQRMIDERQLALIAFLEGDVGLEDSSSLTESTEDGWWYSAAIPGNRVATVFVGKPDSLQRKQWNSEEGWWRLLAGAPHTERRLSEGAFSLMSDPRFVSAESSILSSVAGEGWMAIGDAAISYDPIASHGIMMAMVSARDASGAVASHFREGRMGGLAGYEQKLRVAFRHYVTIRKSLYAQLERDASSAKL